MPDRPLRIALIAHDARKGALVEWAQAWREALPRHRLCGTGTTAGEVMKACPEPDVEELLSGPKGGGLQVGARIAVRELDALVFFPDPESPHPHENSALAGISPPLVSAAPAGRACGPVCAASAGAPARVGAVAARSHVLRLRGRVLGGFPRRRESSVSSLASCGRPGAPWAPSADSPPVARRPAPVMRRTTASPSSFQACVGSATSAPSAAASSPAFTW